MHELSRSQKARIAIRNYKSLADSIVIRGLYETKGKTGDALAELLMEISPEIYGTMTDTRVVELKGLEYVIDRMPRGIEKCDCITLTAQEEFKDTAFEEIIPLKRRRTSYALSDTELCFVITRGSSEIYDILTHITFLTIESKKIFNQIYDKHGVVCDEWKRLEETVNDKQGIIGDLLDKALWNLSKILGRTYKETKATYDYLQLNHEKYNANNGLFQIVYQIGRRMIGEELGHVKDVAIQFTPSLNEMIGHHLYAEKWALSIKERIKELGFQNRPVHVVSANMHSIVNVLYSAGALIDSGLPVNDDLYEMITENRDNQEIITEYASNNGFYFHGDNSGSNINVQLIDTTQFGETSVHHQCKIDFDYIRDEKPLIVVMDYAFGIQAFELMDELLKPCTIDECEISLEFKSVSVMGKAGILPGEKGDIMLANAHVMEGTANNYIVLNDLKESDFDNHVTCYTGPILTVLGTSLQNRAVLERFYKSSWHAIGLEMEGGHYQRAINAAVIQKHIPENLKTRYAYYASDNPLLSGQTLASGPMGVDGIIPTYTITKAILQKVLNP